jgi:hypothetical protein
MNDTKVVADALDTKSINLLLTNLQNISEKSGIKSVISYDG